MEKGLTFIFRFWAAVWGISLVCVVFEKHFNSNISRFVKLLLYLVNGLLYIISIHVFTETRLELFYSKLKMAFGISGNIHLRTEEIDEIMKFERWILIET